MIRQRHLDTRRRLTSAAFDGTRARVPVPGHSDRGAFRLPRSSRAVELSREPFFLGEFVDVRPTCKACGSREGTAFALFGRIRPALTIADVLEQGEDLCLACWSLYAPVFLAAAARGRVA